ncbi:MAG: hypothetical protein M3Z27_04230 [Actinomycetota bacterium]|nr:hypothetical protein [Actinomycetota bacterium]
MRIVRLIAVFGCLLTFPSPALAEGLGGQQLPFAAGGPFTVVEQQITIVRSPPSTLWALGGRFGLDPIFNNSPGTWSMGVQLRAGAPRGGASAQAVFTERGGGALLVPPEVCQKDRTGTNKTCRLPIPFAPGDRYELLHGGGGGSGDGVVHDATINFDAFSPIDHGSGWFPPLSGLHDTTSYLSAGACAGQRRSEARVSAPLLNDYGLLSPIDLGVYGVPSEPISQATPVPAGGGRAGCARGSHLRVAPTGGLWSEGETFRALPHVRFVFSQRWTPTRTSITGIRELNARVPMIFELDCAGPRCPFGTVRGRVGRLARFIRTVERRPFFAGDRLYVFVGTTRGCGPNCEWGSEFLELHVRRSRPLDLVGCDFPRGPSFTYGRSCTTSPSPRTGRR